MLDVIENSKSGLHKEDIFTEALFSFLWMHISRDKELK